MQTADFDYKDFQNPNQADNTLLVKFFVRPRHDKLASKAEGRPIYKDAEYIDIKVPGNRSAGACRPVTPQDKQRFPEHYARFKQRVDQEPEEGTPLSEWPLVSRSQAEELAFFHVKTVEQLANMADVQVVKFKGLIEVKAKAQRWLQQAREYAKSDKLEKEVSQLREDNKVLREEMMKLVESLKDDGTAKTDAQKRRVKQRAAKKAEDALAGVEDADYDDNNGG